MNIRCEILVLPVSVFRIISKVIVRTSISKWFLHVLIKIKYKNQRKVFQPKVVLDICEFCWRMVSCNDGQIRRSCTDFFGKSHSETSWKSFYVCVCYNLNYQTHNFDPHNSRFPQKKSRKYLERMFFYNVQLSHRAYIFRSSHLEVILWETAQPISCHSCLFLYLLETLKNCWFSDIFRGYRKRPVAWNGLKVDFHGN